MPTAVTHFQRINTRLPEKTLTRQDECGEEQEVREAGEAAAVAYSTGPGWSQNGSRLGEMLAPRHQDIE